MNGGELVGQGAVSEVLGAISGGGLVSKVTVDPNGGGNTASLSFGGYNNASTTGIILFRGAGMGSTPGAGVGSVSITSPTLTGSGLAGTSTVGILKHAIGDTTIAGVGAGLITYDATNGVRLLSTSTEYSADLATANANVRLTSSVASATAAINSLTIASGAAMTGTNVVTITSGDIFVESGVSASVGGKLTTATGTGFNFVTIGDLTASGDLTSTASVPLQKNGAGTLTLTGLPTTGTNVFGTTTVNAGVLNVNSGTAKVASVTVNGGTFKVTGNSRILDTATVTVNSGGTFDYNGSTDTIGGLAGTGTVTGGSGTAAIMSINQTGTLTVSNKLTGNLNVIQRGAGTMVIAGAANDYTGYTQTQAAGRRQHQAGRQRCPSDCDRCAVGHQRGYSCQHIRPGRLQPDDCQADSQHHRHGNCDQHRQFAAHAHYQQQFLGQQFQRHDQRHKLSPTFALGGK